MSCCHLLLSIAPRVEGLKDKEKVSLTGYVYKSLWNRHSVSSDIASTSALLVFTERIMAIRLALSSDWEEQIGRLAQQITLSVAACSSEESHRASLRDGLSQLKTSVDASAMRAENSYLWDHLSLFISCLQALYSTERDTKIQVCNCHVSCKLKFQLTHPDITYRSCATINLIKIKLTC